MVPTIEFRTLSVSSPEPTDRTTEGTVIGNGEVLDLGAVDTTDEAQDSPVRVFWWRVTDMKGNCEVSNMRVWISDTGDFSGNDTWYMDITDTWNKNKTPVQVKTGSPGTAALSEPSANLTKYGGETITGTAHDQTSQYIYLSGNIGVNETTGEKSGLKLTIKFDYH
ncbi:hypothetical protein ACFL6H_04830 [Candidatus Latescibacterota bacterium]